MYLHFVFIFPGQICMYSSDVFAPDAVVFLTVLMYLFFRCRGYSTWTGLILCMTHLLTFSPTQAAVFTFYHSLMSKELLLSWVKWLLLCHFSFTPMPHPCEESWTPVCHRYGESCIRIVAWSVCLCLVHNSVLPHWHCSHFNHLLWKHVGCFLSYGNRNL